MVTLTAALVPPALNAQGTKLWSVSRYEDMERGTTDGAAIRNDGHLEAGLAISMLYMASKNFAWAVASDAAGNAYIGLGGTSAGNAVVMKIAPEGKATQVFESKEMAVQAVRVAGDGSLLVATSPEGKVYRVPAGGGTPTVVFDPSTTEEKPKYLWDVVDAKNGDIYVATGAPAAVYRLSNGAKPELLFKTTDQHIRCLLLAQDNTLWAGSDGEGVVYRYRLEKKGERPFAAYSAARREITALAADNAGNVYAAGVGGKGRSTLPPLPVTGNLGMTITFLQPGSSSAAGANGLVPDGSEIYRIAADGSPTKLVTLKDDVVYGLIVRNENLLAATGNRGRIYRIDTKTLGRFTDVAHVEASQGMAFAPMKDGLLVASSNSGKLFRLGDGTPANAAYTSEVFDAGSFAQWGRFEVRGDKGYELYVRSGNVENPLTGWSDWTRVGEDGIDSTPQGRYAQWKAVFTSGDIDSVSLNYLARNVAPVIDDIVVQPGARVAPATAVPANNIVQIAFPNAVGTTPPLTFTPDANTAPLTAQKDKTAITVRWNAHDDNGDDLMYAVWYRGTGESNWRLLKDKISEKAYSFDSALLPDGDYEIKVVASDAPVHTDADALTDEKVSEAFVVDTTPPVPGELKAELVRGGTKNGAQQIHATFAAHDAISPIAHAEYSVDAGPWQYLEPTGRISDSLSERYDFTAEIPAATTQVADPQEHVLAIRVYDRYENMTAVKAVVR